MKLKLEQHYGRLTLAEIWSICNRHHTVLFTRYELLQHRRVKVKVLFDNHVRWLQEIKFTKLLSDFHLIILPLNLFSLNC